MATAAGEETERVDEEGDRFGDGFRDLDAFMRASILPPRGGRLAGKEFIDLAGVCFIRCRYGCTSVLSHSFFILGFTAVNETCPEVELKDKRIVVRQTRLRFMVSGFCVRIFNSVT